MCERWKGIEKERESVFVCEREREREAEPAHKECKTDP